MTDFYQWAFGRPSPGKQRRRAFQSYANDGENREEVERTAERTQYRGEETLPPDWARGARGRYDEAPVEQAPRSAPRVPLSQLTGRDRNGAVERLPYGDDFASWEAETRSDIPSYMRRPEDPAPGDEPSNPGREPRNPGNQIGDAPRSGEDRRFYRQWHEAEALARQSEARARQRQEEGRQTPADVFHDMIYGRRQREIEEENADMQDDIRNNRY